MESTLQPSRSIWYRPLQGASNKRLVILQEGKDNEKISCKLVEPELGSSLKYEALSYVWDQLPVRKRIICNDTPFPVTGNLHAALRRLRRPNESRVLWIDQICIDQENIPERNQQVQIMRDIYRGAEKVLIWLGKKENDSGLAMDFIGTVADVILSLPPGALLTNANITDYGLPPCPSRRWSALGDLLKRPWFQRVWVVQECVMAKDAVVLCGGAEIQWSSLEMLIVGRRWPPTSHPILQICVGLSNLSKFIGPLERTALRQVYGIVRQKIMLGSNSRFDIAEAVMAFKDCHATDPRDKLFAFLGCVPVETATQYSPPDYGRSVKDVYTEIAFVSLSKFSNMGILSFAGCGQQQHDVPSWVPNWSGAASGITLQSRAAGSIQRQKAAKIDPVVPLYSASKNYSPNFKLGLENGTLTISGKILGKLAAVAEHLGLVGPVPTTPESPKESNIRILTARQTRIKECFEMAAQCDPYPSGGTYISACNQTLVVGATPSEERTTAAEAGQNLEAYNRMNSHFLGTGPRLDNQTPEQLMIMGTRVSTFEFAFEQASSNRAFAVTEEKYVGLVPVMAKAGDYVCIILGCVVPFIVREDDGKYVLVGECYIHGIMNGEAMDMEKYKIQDIILK